jgi:hypothetical protein
MTFCDTARAAAMRPVVSAIALLGLLLIIVGIYMPTISG